jgi:hypothetical protein
MMKEGTVPVPLTIPALRARETYYLFVELSHAGDSEVAEVINPSTFKFFPLLRNRSKEDVQALFPHCPAIEDDHLKYYEYRS